MSQKSALSIDEMQILASSLMIATYCAAALSKDGRLQGLQAEGCAREMRLAAAAIEAINAEKHGDLAEPPSRTIVLREIARDIRNRADRKD